MNADLDPDTMYLNKDTYTIFKSIDESLFNDIFTNLSKIYQKFIPLKEHIYEVEKIFFKRLSKMVLKKCPLFK